MKYRIRAPVPIAVACLCMLSLPLSALYTLIDEDFTDPPSALDQEVWTATGVYTPVHIVSNGQLTMRSAGWTHHATITTVADDFNFFLRDYTVSLQLSNFPEPNWENDLAHDVEGLEATRDVFFVIGPASEWDHYIDRGDQYYKWEGFGFALRWQVTSAEEPRSGRLELYSPNEDTGIPNEIFKKQKQRYV